MTLKLGKNVAGCPVIHIRTRGRLAGLSFNEGGRYLTFDLLPGKMYRVAVRLLGRWLRACHVRNR